MVIRELKRQVEGLSKPVVILGEPLKFKKVKHPAGIVLLLASGVLARIIVITMHNKSHLKKCARNGDNHLNGALKKLTLLNL